MYRDCSLLNQRDILNDEPNHALALPVRRLRIPPEASKIGSQVQNTLLRLFIKQQTICLAPFFILLLSLRQSTQFVIPFRFQNIGYHTILRIPIPSLTEERPQQLAKHVRKVQEHGHNEVRQIRRAGNDEMKKLEKDKQISKDDEKRGIEMVQKLHDEYIKKFDDLTNAKEQEILHS